MTWSFTALPITFSVPTEKRKVDWEQIKRCLVEIDKNSREFLQRALLIGGAACWFYRIQLKRANDPDFNVNFSSPENESQWLSRDIDFTGILSEVALSLLPHNIAEHEGRRYIEVEGVRLGFAQAGVTIDPEEAIAKARVGRITLKDKQVEFLVADPLTLYYEKDKLCAQRGYPNDHLHRGLLHDFVAFELVCGAERMLLDERLPVADARQVLAWWLSVRNRAPEILKDDRIQKRLAALLADKPEHPIATYLADA